MPLEFEVLPLPRNTYWRSSGCGPRGGGFHPAIDEATPQGTPILAPNPGLANQMWDPGGGGNWTMLWRDDGSAIGLGHADTFADDPLTPALDNWNGKRVPAGTVLAYVGSTGRSSGAHVHVCILPPGSRSYSCEIVGLWDRCEAAGRFVDADDTPELVTDPTAPPAPPVVPLEVDAMYPFKLPGSDRLYVVESDFNRTVIPVEDPDHLAALIHTGVARNFPLGTAGYADITNPSEAAFIRRRYGIPVEGR